MWNVDIDELYSLLENKNIYYVFVKTFAYHSAD